MHYPWWYVPSATAPMLVAAIATFHVWVALYAVGGGIILAFEVGHARRNKLDSYLGYLKKHTGFFILITIVYGAITGVGIWWTIALTSPLATQALIHIFVFGWAMEYVFFIVEIIAAFLFYYMWNKIRSQDHVRIGWIYGFSAWMSLVLITGITAFQLNSGGWEPGDGFWTAFWNPQTIPQIIARTGGALLLAALYVYLHSAFALKQDEQLRFFLAKRIFRYVVLGAALTLVGGAAWFANLPERSYHALESASALNIMAALIVVGTILMMVLAYFGLYRNPGWLSQGFAILLFLGGIAHVTEGEFIREAVRKPYIVDNLVLGSQIFESQKEPLKEKGYINEGVWLKHYMKSLAPEAAGADGRFSDEALLELPRKKREEAGKAIFMYHCNNCHAIHTGLAGMHTLTHRWSDEMLFMSIKELDRMHIFMPPFSGTDAEIQLLVDYLKSLRGGEHASNTN